MNEIPWLRLIFALAVVFAGAANGSAALIRFADLDFADLFARPSTRAELAAAAGERSDLTQSWDDYTWSTSQSYPAIYLLA
jgi:hypothetical protein